MSQSYTYTCEHCQATVTLHVGISANYIALSRRLKQRVHEGRYGTACQRAMTLPGTVIDATRRFYMCENHHYITSLAKDIYQSYLGEEISYAFYFSPQHYKCILPFHHTCPTCYAPMYACDVPEHLTCQVCSHEMKRVKTSFLL